MARTHGRIGTGIWADGDFTALTEAEQRAYFLAISQPGLSFAGVVSYTLRRWEGLAADSSIARLRKTFASLQRRLYVLIDPATEEMLVRSFVKNDGILSNPNVSKAAVTAYRGIHSPVLRGAFVVELRRLNAAAQEPGWEKGWSAGLDNLLSEPLPEGFPNPLLEGVPEWSEYARAAPTPTCKPLPTACPHGADKPSLCGLCRAGTSEAIA